MIWIFWVLKCLTGVAFFLMALNMMEDALKAISNRPFKLFLLRNTKNRLTGLTIGTFATGIFQSSSVVNLITASFLESGLLKLENALAILLGTNLGSTISTWLVLYLGFIFNFNDVAYSLTGIFGILMTVYKNQKRLNLYYKLLTGFGMIFIGLSIIREGLNMDGIKWPENLFHSQPAIYLLLGIILTAIIQSTSLTAALVLSLFHKQSIDFISCAYIILGSEIGSSTKLFIASLNGEIVKKRLAIGNFIYNSISVALTLIILKPIIFWIEKLIETKNPLIGVAIFQTIINLIGIVVFFPIINKMVYLLNRFIIKNKTETQYLQHANLKNLDSSMIALQNETKRFIEYVIFFMAKIMGTEVLKMEQSILKKDFSNKETMIQYDYLKNLHGQIHSFCLQLINENDMDEKNQQIERIFASARNAMYAAKSIKNVIKDINQLKASGNEIKYQTFLLMQENVKTTLISLNEILNDTEDKKTIFSKLKSIHQKITLGYNDNLSSLYNETKFISLSDMELSTLINLNRETYLCYKSFLFAIKELTLDKNDSVFFDKLPGFIR